MEHEAFLREHDCDWVLDLEPSQALIEAVMVYLDARDSGVSAQRPEVRALVMLDRVERICSRPIPIMREPVRLVPKMKVLSGYAILTLDGQVNTRFDTLLRGFELHVSETEAGEIKLDGLMTMTKEEWPGHRNPRINLIGEPRRRGLLARLRDVFSGK